MRAQFVRRLVALSAVVVIALLSFATPVSTTAQPRSLPGIAHVDNVPWD
jgi:hypothetical protein